jgi:hypothetical protein
VLPDESLGNCAIARAKNDAMNDSGSCSYVTQARGKEVWKG